MMERLYKIAPYSMEKEEKHQMLNDGLMEVTRHHYEKCLKYKRILDAAGFDVNANYQYKDIPFLPVRLFKEYDLMSIDYDAVVKTLTSSGTTGQQVSKIYLDKEAVSLQTKTLTHIMSDLLGENRVPMIIIDSSAVLKNRAKFSARGAGIVGFSIFGRDRMYALDENMELDIDGLKQFLSKHKEEKIFLFGFTFMIWQHFYKKLVKTGYRPDLSKGILVHGGGWKKLISESVSANLFKKSLKEVCGIDHVHDYYGMVEQTGVIFMECENGHLHCSNFSDVIIRNPLDWSVCNEKQKGIIEVVSVLPKSYPGHVLLTEDEGVVLGEDNCPCGRKGKYFKIVGRIKNAEIRGCSDTYADIFAGR